MDLDTQPAGRRREVVVLCHDDSLTDDVLAAVSGLDLGVRVTSDVADVAGTPRVPAHAAHDVLVVCDRRLARLRPPVGRPDRVVVTVDPISAELWRDAVDRGAGEVLRLPQDRDRLRDHLARPALPTGPRGRLVAVTPGLGGAGASTLAAAVALQAARGPGPATLLLDMDPCGGGLDTALGVEDHPGVRWPALHTIRGRLSGRALRDALPATRGVAVLACGTGEDEQEPPVTAVRSVLAAALGSGDLVVADVARAPGPGGRALLTEADLVVVVVPARPRGVTAAHRMTRVHGPAVTGRTGLVVRTTAGGARPPDVAAALGLPLLAAWRPDRRLGPDDAPAMRGVTAAVARRVLEAVPAAAPVPRRSR